MRNPTDPEIYYIAEPAPNNIGSYELSEEERAEVLAENLRRGTLHLIEDRNSGLYRDNIRRKSEV